VFLSNAENSVYGGCGIKVNYIVCSNPDCKELSLNVGLSRKKYRTGKAYLDFPPLKSWSLIPESHAKPQAACVPSQLANDYYEACKIRDLSPKASATLSRRCIQGMIRDFCEISKNRLIDEIRELRNLADKGELPSGVAADTIDAIDHIRSIGNIGAHFEKDIDVIVDVDPGEAQALLELIEMLFEEWYVARDVRSRRLKRIESIGVTKQKERQEKKNASKEAAANDLSSATESSSKSIL
jgi:hypothetical protein